MKAKSTKEYVERERERILSACTQCGRCFEVCPMANYVEPDKASHDSRAVVGGILAILGDQKGDAPSLSWARFCMASGECVPACPESVNPMLMVRLARMIASGGTGNDPQFKMVDDLAHFPRMRTFAQMQLSADEVDEWL